MLPSYTFPVEWLSRRASSPSAVLRRVGEFSFVAQLVAAMQPGDELRKFNSPRSSSTRLAGRSGYAIVRHGKPLTMVVTRLN